MERLFTEYVDELGEIYKEKGDIQSERNYKVLDDILMGIINDDEALI